MDRLNWEHWEQLASLHGTGTDRYYDLEALVAGGSLMGDEERAALSRATGGAGVSGLDVMHLQCHLGCDAITLAREGARVTAVDFSPTALARVDDLAARCGVVVGTRQADSTDLPHDLDASFDLVYATIGVLCWIERIDRWMEGVARILRPGGRLVLVELHPLLEMVGAVEPLVMDFPYNFDGPHEFSGSGSYANRDADVTWTTTQYAHGLAQVVMAAHDAGLRTTYLEEHLSMGFDPRGMDPESVESDGGYRLRLGVGRAHAEERDAAFPVPVLYTLIAGRPSAGDSPE
jgi:SAM-dependent methyltransferase